MKVTRTSILTSVERTIDLPITEEQLTRFEKGDILIQRVFPDLTPDQREFILTGIVQEEWDEFIVHDEDDDEPTL